MAKKEFDRNILALIGKSIKEGKYLDISYKNEKNETTRFWISILDISASGQLKVNMFNVAYPDPIMNGKISIDRIQSAQILKFSYYEVPKGLLNKILFDEELSNFSFEKYDTRILNYYLDCYQLSADPLLHKDCLIPTIDFSSFTENNPLLLTEEQQKQIIEELYNDNYPKNSRFELALNHFSIDIKHKGRFLVAYQKLSFDPIEHSLHLDPQLRFNPSFYLQGQKHSLSYYSNISQKDFEETYKKDPNQAIESLKSSFNSWELVNTRPEVSVLGFPQIDISPIYDQINFEFNRKSLELPLKAIFQQFSSLDTKNRTRPKIVLYDKQINIDQLRSVYNTLKYPITYVQGPPGTGKTQTILNIILNCITSNRKLLITSNNNIPVDGIMEKMSLGLYEGNPIPLPLLRLGNETYTKEAFKTIQRLNELEVGSIPTEEVLQELREATHLKNRELESQLEKLETTKTLEQNLSFVEELLKIESNPLLEKERIEILRQLDSIDTTEENILIDTFEFVRANPSMMRYFYYESLRCVKKLQSKTLKELVNIAYLKDEVEQLKQFNRWIKEDENLTKLNQAFPIILTTNISTYKLGDKYKFDLLIMDEAGQCEIPTSLLPISKCNNLALIGDTNQLQPIITIEDKQNQSLKNQYNIPQLYDYKENSILSLFQKIDNISRNILLRYHYRCGKKIINFSNLRFYESKLDLERLNKEGHLKLLEVSNHHSPLKNSNLEEAESIVKYIRENNLTDVFILTPFKNQNNLITDLLQREKKLGHIDPSVNCGTIHQVQGQENKTIILSTSISPRTSSKTYDWIKNNSQLINVGITRAKDNLVVVTDPRAIDILSRKDDDLYSLINYVRQNGNREVSKSSANRFTIGFSNDSDFENEFYKTMQHYCSTKGGRFKRNVKLIELFPSKLNDENLNKREFDGVLYEGNIPKVVFELHGVEHLYNSQTIKSDKLKMELLHEKGIRLLQLPNAYVKHYEFIGALINKTNGGAYQRGLFDMDCN